jgi:predicted RNA-binding Zn-ribbon protein involved in translation (DUF1610 family)
MKFFTGLAALGLSLSSLVQFATFFGVDAERSWPSTWLLHLGQFVVIIPALTTAPRDPRVQREKWVGLGRAPLWLRWLMILLGVHAFINIAAFEFVCGKGGPAIEPDGTYSISSHGRIIRHITQAEYHRARGYELRSFSSFWMAMYGLGLTLMVSNINRRKMAEEASTDQASLGSLDGSFPRPLRAGAAIPIWLHQTMLLFCIIFGWIGIPSLVAFYVLPIVGKVCWYAQGVVFLCTWVAGVTVPATLLRRLVPARCPRCGGRTFCQGLLEMNYLCEDCGFVDKRG